jgi:PAS domain S-box-containing protein
MKKRSGKLKKKLDIKANSRQKKTEQTIQKAREELEISVRKRTEELLRTNEKLITEIAERKHIESIMVSERQRFNDILETLPVYLILLTPDYHVPFANRFFRERFGDSGGKRCFEYLFGRTEPCEICETYKTLKKMKPLEWEWIGPDGHNYYIYDFPFRDTDGSTLIMEVGIDITDRKRAEAKLQKSHDELELRVAKRTDELSKSNKKLLFEIGKHKKTEGKLKLSEKRYTLAQSAANIGSWDWNILTNELDWSETIEPIFGFSTGKFKKNYSAFLDCIHPEDKKFVIQSVDDCIKKDKKYDIEHRIVWPDGSVHWVSEKGNVIRDNNGKAVRMLGIVQDITEKKELIEQVKAMAKFPEENPSPILRITKAGYLTHANKSSSAILKKWDCKIGERIPKNQINMVRKILKLGVRYAIELKLKNRIFSLLFVPIKEFDYVNIYGYDITFLKRMENILKESEKRFKTIAENAADPIIRRDRDLRAIYVNPAVEKATGLAKKNYIGKTIKEAGFPDDFCTALEQNFSFVFNTGKEQIKELSFQSPQGLRYYQYHTVPEFNSEGEVETILSISRDITDIKTRQATLEKEKKAIEDKVREKTEQLLKSEKKLEKVKRLSDIGTLAATVAHELRNPLGVIRTAIYNIRRKSKDNLLDKHINNLLFYSRIKVPEYQKIMIGDILEECINNAKHKFVKSDINIEFDHTPIKDLLIEADPLQLTELFTNILNNSFESFENKNGKIKINANFSDSLLNISFEDTGKGIDEIDLNAIFEPFFTRKSKGTGLGLTVCKQIVDLHNGNIKISSSKDKGTIVTISLPLKRDV